MPSHASISVLSATYFLILVPINLSAFSANISENGDAASEIYASSACTMASMPHAAAVLCGTVLISSGSKIAYVGSR